MKRLLLSILLCSSISVACFAQSEVQTSVNDYLRQYQLQGYTPNDVMRCDSVNINDERHEVTIFANEPFCSQPFTPQSVKRIYNDLQRRLPAPYNTFSLYIRNKKQQLIEDLVPNIYRTDGHDQSRLWGNVSYKGLPWMRNTSLPYRVTAGLQNRHLFIWPSHGSYFKHGSWQWQRPYIYGTTEDLFTQSFVFPFLFPMLENAGAIVTSPRERDYQTHEAVVDNDDAKRQGVYAETEQRDAKWSSSADSTGFATPTTLITDDVHPFCGGTYRMANAVNRRNQLSTATWTPNIPAKGRYAVYVSYATRSNSVPDAHYTILHKGGRTTFTVNQQMGGGTWLYLGTFEFDKGESTTCGRVILSNQSDYRGVVTADAVRFGGGMGQDARGLADDTRSAETSGLPRYLEAARYYAQWAGVPDSLVNTEKGENDYNDDLRVRGNMLNYLAAGSPYVPTWNNVQGGHVPFELSLAVHSDAGYRSDSSIYGSLAISTTQDGNEQTVFPSGLSRQASSDFAQTLLTSLTSDISRTFGVSWTQREHWDRNYAETRMPAVPSAILETMSHQNFYDMRYGHDPLFKFTLARSVYKSILRFVNFEHGVTSYKVQPLPPHAFAVQFAGNGEKVRLTWQPTPDSLEASAMPTGYVLYTKVGDEAFDNGFAVGNVTECTVPVAKGKLYAFRVAAVNSGGQSFPSETLCAYRSEQDNAPVVLMVNGFTRVSGPAYVDTPDSLGFRLDIDPGVPYISSTAFSGYQQVFDRSAMGTEGCTGLGFTGRELVGKELAGNTFNFPHCHGKAIAAAHGYSFCSVSAEAFGKLAFNTKQYAAIDYIAGLQGRFPWNMKAYPVFTNNVRNQLSAYLKQGGALLLSGSYIASDNYRTEADRQFVEDVLKYKYEGTARTDSTDFVNGLNRQFLIQRTLSSKQYAVLAPDVLTPTTKTAFSAFAYGGGQSAGVAYRGKCYRVISMGFPFESICDETMRSDAMRAILTFLTK